MVVLTPVGYRTMRRWQGDGSRVQNKFYDSEMVWYGVVKIESS